VFDEIIENNVSGEAAALAFYFLFALFPLILIMLTSFGLFASHKAELQNDLHSYFADFLPRAAFRVLKTVADELAVHATSGKLTFGILTAFWGMCSGINAMISSLNRAYHVRETRSWFKVRAIAFALSLLIPILLLAALFMVLVGNQFVAWLGTVFGLHPLVVLVWEAIQWPGGLFVVALTCGLIYHFGPNLPEARGWQWLTPGSAFGALVWLGASFAFRMYLHFFHHYSATYGSLGAVMILLLWLYVSGLAYLIGGEINAEIWRVMTKRANPTEPTG
jgi:membrane protein